jgi:hypothetical protein
MKYNVIKILDQHEVVLFENQPESNALKLINQLIEQHAENLISDYPDINELDAIKIAESQFLLMSAGVTNKVIPLILR